VWIVVLSAQRTNGKTAAFEFAAAASADEPGGNQNNRRVDFAGRKVMSGGSVGANRCSTAPPMNGAPRSL
jgi:hypothetical protein